MQVKLPSLALNVTFSDLLLHQEHPFELISFQESEGRREGAERHQGEVRCRVIVALRASESIF